MGAVSTTSRVECRYQGLSRTRPRGRGSGRPFASQRIETSGLRGPSARRSSSGRPFASQRIETHLPSSGRRALRPFRTTLRVTANRNASAVDAPLYTDRFRTTLRVTANRNRSAAWITPSSASSGRPFASQRIETCIWEVAQPRQRHQFRTTLRVTANRNGLIGLAGLIGLTDWWFRTTLRVTANRNVAAPGGTGGCGHGFRTTLRVTANRNPSVPSHLGTLPGSSGRPFASQRIETVGVPTVETVLQVPDDPSRHSE